MPILMVVASNEIFLFRYFNGFTLKQEMLHVSIVPIVHIYINSVRDEMYVLLLITLSYVNLLCVSMALYGIRITVI